MRYEMCGGTVMVVLGIVGVFSALAAATFLKPASMVAREEKAKAIFIDGVDVVCKVERDGSTIEQWRRYMMCDGTVCYERGSAFSCVRVPSER